MSEPGDGPALRPPRSAPRRRWRLPPGGRRAPGPRLAAGRPGATCSPSPCSPAPRRCRSSPRSAPARPPWAAPPCRTAAPRSCRPRRSGRWWSRCRRRSRRRAVPGRTPSPAVAAPVPTGGPSRPGPAVRRPSRRRAPPPPAGAGRSAARPAARPPARRPTGSPTPPRSDPGLADPAPTVAGPDPAEPDARRRPDPGAAIRRRRRPSPTPEPDAPGPTRRATAPDRRPPARPSHPVGAGRPAPAPTGTRSVAGDPARAAARPPTRADRPASPAAPSAPDRPCPDTVAAAARRSTAGRPARSGRRRYGRANRRRPGPVAER